MSNTDPTKQTGGELRWSRRLSSSCLLLDSRQLLIDRWLYNGKYQGRIQDLWLGGAWVGDGSGDRLRSPAVGGPGWQSPPEALGV